MGRLSCAVPGSMGGNRVLSGHDKELADKLYCLQRRINELRADLVNPNSRMVAGKEALAKVDDLQDAFEVLVSYL